MSSVSLTRENCGFEINQCNANTYASKITELISEIKKQNEENDDEVRGFIRMIVPVLRELPEQKRRQFMWKTYGDLIKLNESSNF